MTFIIKHKPLPGALMSVEYDCPDHGPFEEFVARDENGDPPAVMRCPYEYDWEYPDEDGLPDDDDDGRCTELAPRIFGAPKPKIWSRDPVPIGRASKSDEKDPRALDTEPLATGKMTKAEWRKWQRGITRERRHQKLLKSGRRQKRIQVG